MKKDSSAAKNGMALVLVLVIVAVVSVLTIHVQTGAASALKRAQIRGLKADLRLAASDAVLYYLFHRSDDPTLETGGTNRSNVAMQAVLPSGIETSVTITPAVASVNPAFSLLADPPVGGRLFLVQATADLDGMNGQTYCFFHRNGKGKLRILAWLERG